MRFLLWITIFTLLLYGDAHIFVYHRFDDPKRASANTSIDQLKAQFDHFQQNGYKVIPLSQLADALHNHRPIDPKWVVLTIDDSYRSFYDKAFELFKSYGYPFTLFVYVEATQSRYRDYMTWQQLKEAAAYGEIALHSYAHPHLISLDAEAIAQDTRKAIELFTKAMGHSPAYYAYPYGEYSSDVLENIQSHGFKLILNQNNGAVNETSNPYNLDRIALTREVDLTSKLKIQHLAAEWIEPQTYPKDALLKSIHAKISPSIEHIEYYISGYGWEPAPVQSGEVKISLVRPLKHARSRIFIRSGFCYSSTIIAKE
ncbi:MAG: polysaccharide deacetylase family protein [Campylobacterales bacterium]|nr:polysaccharide deacetylase family protein [Campylobacterales bacterium]